MGAEFLINTYTTNHQQGVSVSSNGEDYLITWTSLSQDGDGKGIYGQLIDSAGNFIGSEFLINTYTTDYQNEPSVTSNGKDFIVTWTSTRLDFGNTNEIYGKLIKYNGQTTIPEPATILLLISAIAGFLGKRCKR
ncbi:PEP-CTERM sorting domain-containing protein [bacterium]|nr:PEP-CTERM sorting domain-containing protein [bacterium]